MSVLTMTEYAQHMQRLADARDALRDSIDAALRDGLTMEQVERVTRSVASAELLADEAVTVALEGPVVSQIEGPQPASAIGTQLHRELEAMDQPTVEITPVPEKLICTGLMPRIRRGKSDPLPVVNDDEEWPRRPPSWFRAEWGAR